MAGAFMRVRVRGARLVEAAGIRWLRKLNLPPKRSRLEKGKRVPGVSGDALGA